MIRPESLTVEEVDNGAGLSMGAGDGAGRAINPTVTGFGRVRSCWVTAALEGNW